MKISDNAKEWIKDISIALIIGAIILFFIMPTVVREHSMENTLFENDYLFVGRQHYRLLGKPYERGDIIVFKSELLLPNGKEKLLVKRVIAVPGDRVEIKDGLVILNGEALEEKYTKDGYTNGSMDEIVVPEGTVFVLGDNRQNSADSRDPRIGCIDMTTVKGKALIRLFPFNKIGVVE